MKYEVIFSPSFSLFYCVIEVFIMCLLKFKFLFLTLGWTVMSACFFLFLNMLSEFILIFQQI